MRNNSKKYIIKSINQTMSNPIKSLLPTPLSMDFISNMNALVKLPFRLYKFFINCGLLVKPTPININDESTLKMIGQNQNIPNQTVNKAVDAVKSIQKIAHKVIKLMKTSEPQQIESNLQNCQKYIRTVLTENTLIDEERITYLLESLASFVQKSLDTQPSMIETKFGNVEWSIYNLKKTSLNLITEKQSPSKQDQDGQQKSRELKTINKMYVKVSFDQNFTPSQIQKLIGSSFQPTSDGIIECRIQGESQSFNKNHSQRKSKTVAMSLIDFRLFMEELEKVKNLNS